MRVKVIGNIIENRDPSKSNYNHEIYGMILANINTDKAKEIHTKKRFKRLFTFTPLYIKEGKAHLYISGEDTLIKDFINGIISNQLIRIGGKVINITSVEDIGCKVKEKDNYYFRSKLIVNEMENGKVCLSKNKEYIERRLAKIAKDKFSEIKGNPLDKDIKVEIITFTKRYCKYKNHHINYYDTVLKIKGSNEIVNLIYDVGLGENTATGHGFAWEV